MMNQGRFLIAAMCAAAALLTSNAQENEPPAAKPAAPAGSPGSAPEVKFANLIRVVNIQGACDVNNPDLGTFQPAKHNKAYPMGSIFRTAANSSCILVFSAEDNAALSENTELTVTACKENCESLTLKLISGSVKTTLRDNLADGTFFVRTPHTVVKNVSGRGAYSLTTEDTSEVFRLSTITGTAKIEGAHYTIPTLQAANKLTIITAPDRSFTSLTAVSGDFIIELPTGSEEPIIYSMSPQAVVKIWRENAPVGGRAIISTLVVSPTGLARHRFAYAEGRTILKTGELERQSYNDGLDDNLPLLAKPDAPKSEPVAEPLL
ncbi:MAG: hypothetical protein WC340_09715 [Kiritimatiellia bacterium]